MGAVKFNKLRKIGYPSPPPEKPSITGVVILGDSLSDDGGKHGKYKTKILGCIPMSLLLHKSPHAQFTNGFVWPYPLIEKLKWTLSERPQRPNPHLASVTGSLEFSTNMAQGGATAYNYGRFFNFFRYIKGFFLSFFVGNIQKQATELKQNRNIQPGDLCLIFAGANDLLTVGYDDKGGATRAIAGIADTLRLITTPQKDADEEPRCTQNVVLFTLPDFSKTPRFSTKSDKVKKQAQATCALFNQKLIKLAKSYQGIDFSFCAIHQLSDKAPEAVKQAAAQIEKKGILIVGTGRTRRIYFVKDKQLLTDPIKKNDIVLKVSLSKKEKELIGSKTGKVDRTSDNTLELNRFVQRLTSKAKLNIDVKIFDAAATFEEIEQNPEHYGFTNGCAVYCLAEMTAMPDTEIISKKITAKNAVILKKIQGSDDYLSYFVKDSKLLSRKVRLQLSKLARDGLAEKIGLRPFKEGISELASCEDKHDLWTTRLIQQAVQRYHATYGEKIQLTDVYTFILMAIKERHPNQELLFWDDVHPTVTIHFLLELMFEKFFEDHYKIGIPRKWADDMALANTSTQFEIVPEKRVNDEVVTSAQFWSKSELPPHFAEAPATVCPRCSAQG